MPEVRRDNFLFFDVGNEFLGRELQGATFIQSAVGRITLLKNLGDTNLMAAPVNLSRKYEGSKNIRPNLFELRFVGGIMPRCRQPLSLPKSEGMEVSAPHSSAKNPSTACRIAGVSMWPQGSTSTVSAAGVTR